MDVWFWDTRWIGTIFYMCYTIQRFHPKLNKSFLLLQPRFFQVETRKEDNVSNAFRTTSFV